MNSLWHGLRWLLQPYKFFASLPERTSWSALPGLGRLLITGEPELVGELSAHPDLVGGRAHRALRAVLGEDHLIVLWGAAHRERRRVVFPALHHWSDDELVLTTLRAELPWQGRFTVYELARDLVLRITIRALLGTLERTREDEIMRAARAFSSSFSNPLNLFVPALQRDLGPWSPWGRLLRRRSQLAGLLTSPRLAVPPSELLSLLMFGHETTAGALAWAFAYLRPEDLGPIREGDEAYTEAFLNETLRLAPPVAQLTRVAERATRLGGFKLPAGTTVMPSIWLSGRDPETFPHPERFCPGRPLPGRSFYPFGLGNRICPGKAMAMRQMVLFLQTVLRERRVELPRAIPGPTRQLFLVLPRGGTSVGFS